MNPVHQPGSERAGLPAVAIVGRPNVGKSAIFNHLAGRRIAIVHDQPGVTRDRITATCDSGNTPFTVIDTGGIGAAVDADFSERVRTEAMIAVESADVILLVVDGTSGLHPVDAELARSLRRAGARVILVVNKIDTAKHEPNANEFASLGFESTLPLSAAHARGFRDLIREIDRLLEQWTGPGDIEAGPRPLSIAIVGRPNVGKSSLINAILKDDRTIVSEIAGTTRDAVDVPYRFDNRDYLLIDTAGIRPKGRRDTSVEAFSVMRSERSIRRADLTALVIDAAMGVTAQDKRIARQILENEKPCIVILNKFDLFFPEAKRRDRLESLLEDTRESLFFLPYAPFVATSALKNESVNRLINAVQKVRAGAHEPLGTGNLNRILQQAMETTPPPSRRNRRLKLLYATQVRRIEDAIPVPKFLLFVNDARLMERTYSRFLESKLRQAIPYEGLPIIFNLRDRKQEGTDRRPNRRQ